MIAFIIFNWDIIQVLDFSLLKTFYMFWEFESSTLNFCHILEHLIKNKCIKPFKNDVMTISKFVC